MSREIGSSSSFLFGKNHPIAHCLPWQECFATSLAIPSLFSDYFSTHVAKELMIKNSLCSHLTLTPINMVLNAALLPFTVTASLVSMVALAFFAVVRGSAADELDQETWNRAMRISFYGAFVAPTANFLSIFTGIVDPTYSVVEKVFGGIPKELQPVDHQPA